MAPDSKHIPFPPLHSYLSTTPSCPLRNVLYAFNVQTCMSYAVWSCQEKPVQTLKKEPLFTPNYERGAVSTARLGAHPLTQASIAQVDEDAAQNCIYESYPCRTNTEVDLKKPLPVATIIFSFSNLILSCGFLVRIETSYVSACLYLGPTRSAVSAKGESYSVKPLARSTLAILIH